MHILFIILLVFVLLGAVGVATSKDYKDTSEGRKKRRNILSRVAVFAVILLILIAATGGKNSNAKTTTDAAAPPVNLSVDSKNPDTDALVAQIEKYFKDNHLDITNLEISNYEGGGYGVYTDYIFNTTNMTATKYTQENYYLMLHKTGKNIKAASAYQYINTQDKYGKATGPSGFYKTIINDPDWSKINWNQADADLIQQTIPDVWSVTQDYSSLIK